MKLEELQMRKWYEYQHSNNYPWYFYPIKIGKSTIECANYINLRSEWKINSSITNNSFWENAKEVDVLEVNPYMTEEMRKEYCYPQLYSIFN